MRSHREWSKDSREVLITRFMKYFCLRMQAQISHQCRQIHMLTHACDGREQCMHTRVGLRLSKSSKTTSGNNTTSGLFFYVISSVNTFQVAKCKI